MNDNIIGSIWRRWDLQIQPIKSEWFANIDENLNRIEQRVKDFINAAIDKKIGVIGITDHNTGVAIDYALEYVQNKNIVVLPGVELEANSGEHIIIIFNNAYKKKIQKTTWRETIETFLQTICNITPPFFDNGYHKKIGVTTENLIEKVNKEDIGIVIFAHCVSNDGFFQRSGDASKREQICKMFSSEFGKFVFEIKENRETEKIIEKLKGWGLDPEKYPIISSSDAHEVSDVGRFFTWIKADPTYEGLKQILYEPTERIFIGDEPELLRRVRENPTKFIKSILIKQVKGYDEKTGIWFKDISIPINPGLVAIIGNKGAGKSALLDIIALCGNSHQYKEFSFLREDRFKRDGLAKNFEATLKWESRDSISKNLFDDTGRSAPERVRYLPQNYFEKLTNALDAYRFKETLENVVFSHLPEEEKLGKKSFEELIKYKKEIIEQETRTILDDIDKINDRIIELEKKEHPEYKRQIENKLELKRKELEEHEKIKPKQVRKPELEDKISQELEELKEKLNRGEQAIKVKEEKNVILKQDIEDLGKVKAELINHKRQFEKYLSTNEERFKKHKLNIRELIKIKLNLEPIDNLIKLKEHQYKENLEKIKELRKANEEFEKKIKEIRDKLSEEQREYEKYLQELKKWEEKKKEIIGDKVKPDTLTWLENELNYIDENLRKDLETLRQKRISLALDIYEKKMELVNIYKSFKESVDKEISSYQSILGEYEINIEATLKSSEEFYDKFLSFINQDRKGSFRGKTEGKQVLKNLVKKFNILSKDDITHFLNEVITYLEYDKREELQDKEKRRYVPDQIPDRKLKDFYRYLFSLNYIQPAYELKLGDKNLAQLSPGEKGALLIVFYLMLDKDNTPLLIDQPEENLDNESIYKVLTHFIKLTKKRRQIILVTHNPNLAIVGDAEQIIFVNIDKKNKNKFSFEAGAIENPKINKRCSDILEGTLKAFDIRRLKYLRRGAVSHA